MHWLKASSRGDAHRYCENLLRFRSQVGEPERQVGLGRTEDVYPMGKESAECHLDGCKCRVGFECHSVLYMSGLIKMNVYEVDHYEEICRRGGTRNITGGQSEKLLQCEVDGLVWARNRQAI